MAERKQSRYGQRPETTADGQLKITLIDKDSDNAVMDVWTPDLSRISPDVTPQIFAEGVSRILQQRASNVEPLDKFAYYDSVLEQWAQGNYESERKAGVPTVPVEIIAMAELQGVTDVAAVQKELYSKYTKEEREKMYAFPAVKDKVAEIKARRQAQGDTAMDLSGFLQ